VCLLQLRGVLERERIATRGAQFDATPGHVKRLAFDLHTRVRSCQFESFGLGGVELRKAQAVLCF